MDKDLIYSIFNNLLNIEKKQFNINRNKNINPVIINNILYNISKICFICSLANCTAFLAKTLFLKTVKLLDNYVSHALNCISIATKIDDPSEKIIPYYLLFQAAYTIENNIWIEYLKYVNFNTIIGNELHVIKRLDFNLLLVTPVTFFDLLCIPINNNYKSIIVEAFHIIIHISNEYNIVNLNAKYNNYNNQI